MKYFFIGIGGIGMSALAELLHAEGHEVRGSDVASSKTLDRLIKIGISVQIGHEVPIFVEIASGITSGVALGIASDEIIVVNSAISVTNPIWLFAQKLGCKILRRGELLAEFVNNYHGLVVAGSHGKTTTSSMLVHILEKSNFSPSFAIGGRLMGSGRNSALGAPLTSASGLGSGGQHLFVAEGDESDASFLKLQPKILAVTNIDADHMSTYGHSFEALIHSFTQWILNLPEQGVAVLNQDDPGVCQVVLAIKKMSPNFGENFWEKRVLILVGKRDSFIPKREPGRVDFLSCSQIYLDDVDQQVIDIKVNFSDSRENIAYQASWPLIGEFNAMNALMAGAMAHAIGVSWSQINQAMASYPGVERRMQYLGSLSGAKFFEDYGHHPAEISASLKGLRKAYPEARLIQVFQPHRYTRTRDLWSEFIEALSLPDVLILLPIYAASEAVISGVSSEKLFDAIRDLDGKSQGSGQVIFAKLLEEAFVELISVLKTGDLVLLHGAGDMPQKLGLKLFEKLSESAEAKEPPEAKEPKELKKLKELKEIS